MKEDGPEKGFPSTRTVRPNEFTLPADLRNPLFRNQLVFGQLLGAAGVTQELLDEAEDQMQRVTHLLHAAKKTTPSGTCLLSCS